MVVIHIAMLQVVRLRDRVDDRIRGPLVKCGCADADVERVKCGC